MLLLHLCHSHPLIFPFSFPFLVMKLSLGAYFLHIIELQISNSLCKEWKNKIILCTCEGKTVWKECAGLFVWRLIVFFSLFNSRRCNYYLYINKIFQIFSRVGKVLKIVTFTKNSKYLYCLCWYYVYIKISSIIRQNVLAILPIMIAGYSNHFR